MKSVYEKTAELVKSGNKKEIFDLIYLNQNMVGGVAETIADFLKACSTTFVSDIAKKYRMNNEKGNNSISEKQVWCMTFEAIKIAHMIDAWIEREISETEPIDIEKLYKETEL